MASNLTRVLPWLPVGVLAVTVVASATTSQFQIRANTDSIEDNAAAIELRVPTFLYEGWKKEVTTEIVELASDVEDNSEELNAAKNGAIRTDSRIQLEVERLRHEIEKNEQEQNIKLDNILNKLNTLQGTTR